MKIHKTPYKWAIGGQKWNPKSSRGGIVIDDLSNQKSQNALKTGGGLREKKNKLEYKQEVYIKEFADYAEALKCF